MSSKPDSRPVLVLVGGFLGAGKTTLLLRAARELMADGVRVALITNDQGGELVDTRFAESTGVRAREVTGGCFCCRFSDLLSTARSLRDFNPQVILAEPVGSCTDIVATTLRPLEELFGSEFRIAPFTVLVDPRRIDALQSDAAVAYLFRKQIEEADLICYTHVDRQPDVTPMEGWPLRCLSGLTGSGVRPWLNEVLSGEGMPKHRVLDIDYAAYAEAEAALGWVNWSASLRLRRAAAPAYILGGLLESVDSGLTKAGVHIFHLKGTASAQSGFVKASITSNGEEPAVEGNVMAAPARNLRMLVNLRALGDPGTLILTLEECAAQFDGKVEVKHAEAFRPSAPRPEMRFV